MNVTAHNNMNLQDITAIMELLEQIQPTSMLEIGINTGNTAKQILDNFYSIRRYVGIDLSENGKHSEYRNENAHIIPSIPAAQVLGRPCFELILRPHGSFDVTAKELGEFDVVLVDGDHMLWGIMHDTGLAKRCAKKLIIWHDYTDLEAKPFVDFLRGHLSIVHRVGTSVAFAKI
jgi:hypothetical protein